MFASVAYNWTFYYLLALIVAAREMTRDRSRRRERCACRVRNQCPFQWQSFPVEWHAGSPKSNASAEMRNKPTLP